MVGNMTAGFAGDSALAISAELHGPRGMAYDPWGNLYIADLENNRIRKVGNNMPNSVISLQANKQHVSVYPDPNDGQFSVLVQGKPSESFVMAITDLTGRLVTTQSGKCNLPLHVAIEQPSGVYLLTASTSTGRYNQKVVINR
jgi:sugar lactone lactonase YvrE